MSNWESTGQPQAARCEAVEVEPAAASFAPSNSLHVVSQCCDGAMPVVPLNGAYKSTLGPQRWFLFPSPIPLVPIFLSNCHSIEIEDL